MKFLRNTSAKRKPELFAARVMEIFVLINEVLGNDFPDVWKALSRIPEKKRFEDFIRIFLPAGQLETMIHFKPYGVELADFSTDNPGLLASQLRLEKARYSKL